MGQHGGLQPLERRARVDPELVGQGPPGGAERSQGVGLALRPVEGQRQRAPALLAQRVLLDQRLELGHQHRRVLDLEAGHQEALAGHPAQLGQAGHVGGGPGLVGVLRERGAGPQLQRLAQRLRCLGGRLEALGPRHQRLEAPRVDGLRGQPHGVAGPLTHDDRGPGARRRARLQPATQVRDVGLQRAHGGVAGVLAPHRLDQPLDRHQVSAGQHQHRQHRALAPPAQVERRAVVRRRQTAQQADPERARLVHWHIHALHARPGGVRRSRLGLQVARR